LLQSISNLQTNLLRHAGRRGGGRDTLETGGYRHIVSLKGSCIGNSPIEKQSAREVGVGAVGT
jgi:hypothetical protein